MRRLLGFLICAVFGFASVLPAQAAGHQAQASRTRSWVFAIDTATKDIVKVPVNGGRVRNVVPSKTAWAVNAAGDVYVVDEATKTVTRAPADSSRPKSIRARFTDPTDVQLDASGRVYVVDGSRVVRLSHSGKKKKVVANQVSAAVFVRADGTVSTAFASDADHPTPWLLTYPARGGRAVEREVTLNGDFFPFTRALLGDGAGNLFLHTYSPGASGFNSWERLPAMGDTATELNTHLAYDAVAVDPKSRLYLAETVSFCAVPSVNEGTCTPDRSVNSILRYAPNGKRTSLTIDPFTFDGWSDDGSTFAADSVGRLFVAQATGPSAGLLEYGARGGSAKVLASGTFTEPKRNR